jgi:hypothetical protein
VSFPGLAALGEISIFRLIEMFTLTLLLLVMCLIVLLLESRLRLRLLLLGCFLLFDRLGVGCFGFRASSLNSYLLQLLCIGDRIS